MMKGRWTLKTPWAHRIPLAAWLVVAAFTGAPGAAEKPAWTDHFDLSTCTWTSRGRTDFFVLEPGYRATLEGREGKSLTHVENTVLDETQVLNGIETRIVEERESLDGALVEVSRNFYALCGPSNDVYYFGEDVDIYKDGKISGHEGGWRAFASGAKPGLFLPSRPLLGSRFYQELAPGVAMDRVEIVGDSDSVKTPAGSFENCVKTEETNPLENGAREYKLYARGVGLVKDEDLVLVKYGFISKVP
ncbi:MAG: hypothetical protein HY049_10175 [Acidobacteria bacterium]|nr:hypothetical protein [Acidobacteriota bacterium]